MFLIVETTLRSFQFVSIVHPLWDFCSVHAKDTFSKNNLTLVWFLYNSHRPLSVRKSIKSYIYKLTVFLLMVLFATTDPFLLCLSSPLVMFQEYRREINKNCYVHRFTMSFYLVW